MQDLKGENQVIFKKKLCNNRECTLEGEATLMWNEKHGKNYSLQNHKRSHEGGAMRRYTHKKKRKTNQAQENMLHYVA